MSQTRLRRRAGWARRDEVGSLAGAGEDGDGDVGRVLAAELGVAELADGDLESRGLVEEVREAEGGAHSHGGDDDGQDDQSDDGQGSRSSFSFRATLD